MIYYRIIMTISECYGDESTSNSIAHGANKFPTRTEDLKRQQLHALYQMI